MILFICPTCGEKLFSSANEIRDIAYLACKKCNRVVPYYLIDSLKKVCKHFPEGDQLERNNPHTWTIEISTKNTFK